jgi:hypothetical protein
MQVAKAVTRTLVLALTLACVSGRASAVGIVGFNVASSFSLLGSVDALTQPVDLRILLDSVAASDTFVSITSSDLSVLTLSGGGITIPAGVIASSVPVSGLKIGAVTLTAALNGVEATALVSVVTAIPTVPENGTVALLAAGGPLLLWVASRRARQAPAA